MVLKKRFKGSNVTLTIENEGIVIRFSIVFAFTGVEYKETVTWSDIDLYLYDALRMKMDIMERRLYSELSALGIRP